MEYWNNGFKEINIQIGYDFIGVHVLIEYVSGKTEIDAMQASSKVDSTFFVKWSFFRFSCPAFQNSTIPSFRWAYQENGRKKYRDSNEL